MFFWYFTFLVLGVTKESAENVWNLTAFAPDRFAAIIIFFAKSISPQWFTPISAIKNKDKVIVIDAIIYVERESQKGIILGKIGVAIKAVGTSARKTIQNFLKKKVFLGLFVKVAKDWRSRKSQLIWPKDAELHAEYDFSNDNPFWQRRRLVFP